jgi:hypothetical protein
MEVHHQLLGYITGGLGPQANSVGQTILAWSFWGSKPFFCAKTVAGRGDLLRELKKTYEE